MKRFKLALLALTVAVPLAATASCESVKADISQKIINNGLSASGFSLEIVPNDQLEQTGGQVVGHCESDTHKIVYKKTNDAGESNAPASTGTSQDSSQ